jgi:hypothetical protein
MCEYVGKNVELIPMSKIADQWAKEHAKIKDGKYIVRLLKWQAERMVVQGKYRKRFIVDPYITHSNYAAWEPLKGK